MTRKFRTADYEETLNLKISLRDVLPSEHLARFTVDIISQLELSKIYEQYKNEGAPPYAPEVLLCLLFYGYATGTFSSRQIERATHESVPFRFMAGDMHPDHDTIATFRKRFQSEIQELFVQILLIAQTMGVLKLGNISLDGSKIHADASKSKAVSYKRLLVLVIEAYLQQQVAELMALAEAADKSLIPEKMNLNEEIERRQQRLAQLAEAKAVLEQRAQARYAAEQAEYEEKIRQREAKTANQESLLIIANTLSNHPTDCQEALPTVDATIPDALGTANAAALDAGYWSESNVNGLEARGIDPYIATGREPHNQGWRAYFAQQPEPPAANASALEKMAYKLRTEIGQAIYRLRKCTVEPIIGIIKEVLGFRQFSLRGLPAVAGEWTLVCLAFNLKRLHTLRFGL